MSLSEAGCPKELPTACRWVPEGAPKPAVCPWPLLRFRRSSISLMRFSRASSSEVWLVTFSFLFVVASESASCSHCSEGQAGAGCLRIFKKTDLLLSCSSKSATLLSIRKMSTSSALKERAIVLQRRKLLVPSRPNANCALWRACNAGLQPKPDSETDGRRASLTIEDGGRWAASRGRVPRRWGSW